MPIGVGSLKLPQFSSPVKLIINSTVTDDIVNFRQRKGEPTIFLTSHDKIEKVEYVYKSRVVSDVVPEVKIEILGQYKDFMDQITGIDHEEQMKHWNRMEELNLALIYGVMSNELSIHKLKEDDMDVGF